MLLNVLVGSQAHGLAGPESDEDWKGVWLQPLHALLDPWGAKPSARTYGPAGEDVAYELRHWLRLCGSGNPTALEVLYAARTPSPGCDVDERMHWLLEHAGLLLDSKRMHDAHRGFANSQLAKLPRLERARQRKAVASFVRVLGMAADWFAGGDYSVLVPEPRRALLRAVRRGELDDQFNVLCFEAEQQFNTAAAAPEQHAEFDDTDRQQLAAFVRGLYA